MAEFFFDFDPDDLHLDPIAGFVPTHAARPTPEPKPEPPVGSGEHTTTGVEGAIVVLPRGIMLSQVSCPACSGTLQTMPGLDAVLDIGAPKATVAVRCSLDRYHEGQVTCGDGSLHVRLNRPDVGQRWGH